jgi:hypothetical protein
MAFFKKKAEVIDYWHRLVPDFNTSVREFYDAIEKELKERRVPDLALHRIDWNEGGLLSAKREYLRLTRERLVFDICAAPFGSSFFFSCRFAEIPAVINPIAILILLFMILVAVGLFWQIFGFVWGSLLLVVALVIGIYMLRNAVAIGLADLDATLIKTPLFGPVYERFFRKDTYYRQDTRIMYLDTIPAIVKTLVDDVTTANGVKLTDRIEGTAVIQELQS